jgi:SAM-dependent methyltransferase
LGRIHPVPTPDELLIHYQGDDYYTHGGTRQIPANRGSSRARFHMAWRADRSQSLTADFLTSRFPPSAEVCEIGCGDGSLLAGLAARGASVVGIEPDPAARKIAQGRVSVLDGTAEALPSSLSHCRFDAVILSHVLEHCTDPMLAMRNVSKLLRPGGIAIVAVPNNECRGARISGPAWRWLDVPRHLNFFTTRSLCRLARMAHLDVTQTGYEGYCRQFGNEWIGEEIRIRNEFAMDPAPSAWLLLLRTMFAKPQMKYDTVWIVARKPQS